MRVLIANEPRSYREVFASAFQGIRPHIETRAVEPRELDREIIRIRPALVMCDCITEAVVAAGCFWIEHRVDDEAIVVFSNVPTTLLPDNLEFDDLLSIIDWIAELSTHPNRTNGRVRIERGKIRFHNAEDG